METTNQNNEVAIIERSTIVFQNAGAILENNKSRSEKAITVGRNILAEIQASGMTPELDMRAMNYLANVAKASKEMKEGRAEVTQIMDEIKKMYTALENNIDIKKEGTVPSIIQEQRNAYAKQVAEEARRKREEEEKKAAKAKEAVDIKSNAIISFQNQFQNQLLSAKKKIVDALNNATILSIVNVNAKLKSYQPDYKIETFNLLKATVGFYNLHSHEEVTELIMSVKTEELFNQFASTYKAEMGSLTQDLIDKIPSKQSELIEQNRIEEEAAAAAEAARIAEEKRQAAIVEANAEQKKKLEAESRIAREEEVARVEKLKKEQEAAAEEKRKREEEENERIQAEAEESKRKSELEEEMKKQAEQTMIMFDQEAAISESATAPEARLGYDITVTHQAGYVQIFQWWFENEGKNLTLDKMGKTSLDQMKTFVEKHAHKQGRPNIESKFLIYEPSYKAVNRKAAK